MQKKLPTHVSITYFILQVNKMLDTGKYDHITIDDVHQHIDNRDVLRWLKQTGGRDIDLSMYFDKSVTPSARGDFEETFSNYLQNMSGGYRGDERRRWGVQNRGLCFLIAWTLEALGEGRGWQIDAGMFRDP